MFFSIVRILSRTSKIPTLARHFSGRTVAITGCSGIVGSRVRQELMHNGWNVVGIAHPDKQSQGGPNVDSESETHNHLIDIECDLSSSSCLDKKLFEGCSHVLHLAGQGSPGASFEDLLENNIRATYHVLEAAKRSSGVKRVVLASSNHTQHGLTVADANNPGSIDHSRINYHKMKTSEDAFPDSFYAASKLHNEAIGKLYSRIQKHFEVVSLRIGWVLYDNPHALEGSDFQPYLRSVFLSKRDCVGFIIAALQNPLPPQNEGYLCAYAVSNNSESIFDLSQSIQDLQYTPVDSADNL